MKQFTTPGIKETRIIIKALPKRTGKRFVGRSHLEAIQARLNQVNEAKECKDVINERKKIRKT